MNSFDQMMQALKQYTLPSCQYQNHIDNLIIIKNDKDNDCLEVQCGECLKNNPYENEKISLKYMLRLIIEQIFSNNQNNIDNQNENKINKINNLIQLLKENQAYITQELKNLEELKQNVIKYQNQGTVISFIKDIIANIFSKKPEHEQLQEKINELSKLVKVNSIIGNQKIEVNLQPYKFDFSSFNYIENSLDQIKYKLSHLQTTFDTIYSPLFYRYENGNNKAIFYENAKNYPNIYAKKFPNYYEFPVIRINKPILSGTFSIKFKMHQKCYFGLGTRQLPPNGFPGNTEFGYVHSGNGYDSWYNNQQNRDKEYHLTNCEDIVGKEVLFTVNADQKKCTTSYDGKTIQRTYPLQNPVYIIFSLYTGSVELIK